MNAHTSDDKAVGPVATMNAAVQELGANTATKANEVATGVAEKIGSLATVIRENAPHEGAVATAASTVADGLESASSYLREKKFDALAHEVTNLVRTYPVQSLLIGVGLGYLLARRSR
jgi:phage-related tail protein